jgi:putative SOS response-associated peptidase YedK
MCGRFNIIDNPGLQELLRDLGIDLRLPAGVNVAPTEDVPLVRRDDAGASLARAHWWLVPSWAKEISQKYSMFNARSETLGRSPAFRHPFRSQRGLVPMSSFIEWRPEGGVKQPWLITSEQQALAVAALWDVWEGGDQPLLSCTLVTTGAAPEFQPWHARMPVLLTPDESDRWLDNSRAIAADDPLFRSQLKMPLRLAPLSRAVGNSRNKQLDVLQVTGEVVELHPG